MTVLAVALRTASIVALVARAKSHKSLTDKAIAVAVVTAVVHSVHPWSMNLIVLFAFYLSGTKFTKYKHEVKAKLTSVSGTGPKDDAGEEGPRNHIQVLANSVIASVCILLHLATQQDWLMFGVIANYAAVTADTWSSELGILSKGQPILITTLRPCPKGTNGGVSSLGLGVALAGGLYIGLIASFACPMFFNYSFVQRIALVVGVAGLGLFGSVVDSVLGAVLQKSVINKEGKVVEAAGGYKLASGVGSKVLSGKVDILSNNQVNLLMAAITTMVGSMAFKYMTDA